MDANDVIRLISQGKVFFSKKYLPFEYFQAVIGKEYSFENVSEVNFSGLETQAGKDSEIWVYYDTGFSLFAIRLDSEADLFSFVKEAEKNLYASIRFFQK